MYATNPSLSANQAPAMLSLTPVLLRDGCNRVASIQRYWNRFSRVGVRSS